MDELKRLDTTIKWLIYMGHAENDNQLAIKLGYGKSGFSQIVNGKVNLSDNFLNKVCALDENINKDWIRTGNGEMLKNTGNYPELPGIPLIPIEAIPSFNLNEHETDYSMYVIPEFSQKGADFAIRISGNSMYPKFSSGDIVACRKIPEVLFFQWGNVYILETSQGILVKRLHPCEDENFILCVSENKSEYPSFKLPKSDIQGCSIVLGLIHIE